MTDTHPILRLFQAWGAPSSEERVRIVEDVTTADFYYADPHSGPLKDRREFLGFLNIVKTRLPDGRLEASSAPDEHGGHVRCAFTLHRDSGPVRHGVYVADLDSDRRITRMIGFLE